ncbi:MAG: acetylneuraminic acid synthetase, partial [Proteobacteria bacterium]
LNHNGSLERAIELIDLAADAGADCAKFQMRDLASLYNNLDPSHASEDLGAQYTLGLITKFQLSNEQMFKAFDHCKSRGMLPLCTPWDIPSVHALESYGMQGYKVASADLTNHDLLRQLAKTGKPLLLSTGMANEDEIRETASLLTDAKSPYCLLLCNSTYPAPYRDIHLNYFPALKEIGRGCPIGYSGHERGFHVPVAAVALGAKVIEKHFTNDRTLEGNDHKVSLLPAEFEAMVRNIRDLEEALGLKTPRKITQGERMNRETLAKSVVASKDIAAGMLITAEMLDVKSPGKGLQPNQRDKLIGTKAQRPLKKGDFFFPSDLRTEVTKGRPYKFTRPWGVPVRFHDFRNLCDQSNPDFAEFHLSFKDMDLDFRNYIPEKMNCGFTVHSPDLFSGDHLLNLAEANGPRLQRSIDELQRVVDLTRELHPYFPSVQKPLIIASLGGFSTDSFMSKDERKAGYEQVWGSIQKLDLSGVELLPQTLPPFPWYFGGQLFCNLFVQADELAEFCRETQLRICFDVSHSKLAANYYKKDFAEYIDLLAPLTGHYHIVDSIGYDGEGIQIDEGEINFPDLIERMNLLSPGISFIPETWQGHKNNGEGFWIALDRLEAHGM